jgi:peptide/nickel transport system permease protein
MPRYVAACGRALRGVGRWLWSFAHRKPLGAAGAVILLALVAMAIAAPALAPYSPYQRVDAGTFAPPSIEHPMGTDQFGRDILSRIVLGSRNTLRVSLLSVVLGGAAGLLIGLTSGYFLGMYDTVVQRVVDVLQGFPIIVLALAIVATLGPSVTNVVLAIGVSISPQMARVMRSSALAVRGTVYVDAARAIGAGDGRIWLRHVLPNTFAPFIIVSTAQLGSAILIEASMSFLGIGVTEPEPAWGLMLSGSAASYAKLAPWIPIFPGLAISLAVFSANVWGDAVRDTLDPRLRGA